MAERNGSEVAEASVVEAEAKNFKLALWLRRELS